MYSHILFDMDDTLLDFQKAQYVSFKHVLLKYNIAFTSNIYNQYEKVNHSLWRQFDAGIIPKEVVQTERFKQFFNLIGRQVDGAEVDAFYQDCLSTQTWLIPNAKETCMELSKRHTLSIVTNGVGPTQKKRFALSEIAPYFSNILISENIGIAKPNKKFFDIAFKLINCNEKSEIFLVGDSLSSDIQGANNAGIDCCWFNPKGLVPNIPVKITYTITDLRQLIEITQMDEPRLK